MKCLDCLYWVRAKTTGQWDAEARAYPKVDAEWGDCRRYAPRGPVVVPADMQSADPFPATQEGDWCGEFTEKRP